METILYRTRIVLFMIAPFLLTLLSSWDGVVKVLVLLVMAYYLLQEDVTIFRYLSPVVSGLALGSLSMSLALPLATVTGGYLYAGLFWFVIYLFWPES